jgi:hypothetical protein
VDAGVVSPGIGGNAGAVRRQRWWKCFDADAGKDSAREIREYFVPDFSNWKDHDSYQKAFQRLVRDLKAEGETS